MYFVLKETKYETLPSNYTLHDLEGHENKKTALKIAEALQTISIWEKMNKQQKRLRRQHLRDTNKFQELLYNKHFIKKNIKDLIEIEKKTFLNKFNDS